ncbi:hypothetical protein EV175_004094, partial [Coemansia sp. RSA 1933]
MLFKHRKTVNATHSEKQYHCMDVAQTEGNLDVDTSTGLSTSEAERRLTVHGPNQMRGGGGPNAFKILLRQVANLMTVILVAAVIVAFVTKDWIEAGKQTTMANCLLVIRIYINTKPQEEFHCASSTERVSNVGVVIGVIVLNTTIGFMQEFKAEKTMDALRKMSSPTSRVLRNGHQIVVATMDLVPGDILYLESGDVVGADCRLFDIFNYETDEALLTGETLPVAKEEPVLRDPEMPLGDRINLSFASTTVTKGRSKAIVYATGMSTEVGKIAKKLMESNKNSKTPLQKSMDRMAWILLILAIVSVLIVFGANKFKVKTEVLMYAIGLAIATIPEGLVAVVTLTMSLGVSALAKKRALVRQLVALESLGSVTNICSDKTGTLTQSKMVLVRAWLPDEGFFRVAGLGFEPSGDVTRKQRVEINPTSGKPHVNFTPGGNGKPSTSSADKEGDSNSTASKRTSYAEETVVVNRNSMSACLRRLTEAAAL